jgi:hypothetical protein
VTKEKKGKKKKTSMAEERERVMVGNRGSIITVEPDPVVMTNSIRWWA